MTPVARIAARATEVTTSSSGSAAATQWASSSKKGGALTVLRVTATTMVSPRWVTHSTDTSGPSSCLSLPRSAPSRQAPHTRVGVAQDRQAALSLAVLPQPRVPLPLRQLMENWLKLAVPGVGAWAVKNVPASRLLLAPVSVAVPTVVQVVPSVE